MVLSISGSSMNFRTEEKSSKNIIRRNHLKELIMVHCPYHKAEFYCFRWFNRSKRLIVRAYCCFDQQNYSWGKSNRARWWTADQRTVVVYNVCCRESSSSKEKDEERAIGSHRLRARVQEHVLNTFIIYNNDYTRSNYYAACARLPACQPNDPAASEHAGVIA